MHQGDPCAPALFSVATQGTLDLAKEYPAQQQVWYHDGGAIYGPAELVEATLRLLESRLRSKGLFPNKLKCELYRGPSAADKTLEECIHHPQERDSWCYLGVPVAGGSPKSLVKVRANIDGALEGISVFGKKYSAEALQLLRTIASACKVEFVLQAPRRARSPRILPPTAHCA